jgi:hypothetical protein
MPDTEKQPMGGQIYDVYSVKHKLNSSDGFVTEITVAGPNPSLRGDIDVGVPGDRNIIPTSIERDVYSDERVGPYGPGSGVGSINRRGTEPAPQIDVDAIPDDEEGDDGPVDEDDDPSPSTA